MWGLRCWLSLGQCHWHRGVRGGGFVSVFQLQHERAVNTHICFPVLTSWYAVRIDAVSQSIQVGRSRYGGGGADGGGWLAKRSMGTINGAPSGKVRSIEHHKQLWDVSSRRRPGQRAHVGSLAAKVARSFTRCQF